LPDRIEWLSRVIRQQTGEVVGTVQATIRPDGSDGVAEVAWVVAVPHQCHGYARDPAQAMVSWLREQGADTIVAHIHPDHGASAAIARAAAAEPTPMIVGGEIRRQSPRGTQPQETNRRCDPRVRQQPNSCTR
jgi:RimJ/RimL family protein N-acetyltransferase